MTTTTDRRPRRPGRFAAVGAVALTAAVALPAFALDRTNEAPISAVSDVDQANEFDAAQAIEDRRAVAAFRRAEEARKAELDAAIVAAIAALPPEQQFQIKWDSMDDAGRTEMINWFAEQERIAAEQAEAARRAEEARQAEAARRAQQAEQSRQSRQSAPAPSVSGGSVWDTIAQCESSGNWAMNSGNGFYGGLQFTQQSWQYVGGTEYAAMPHQASKGQQIAAAERLLAKQGWGAWPACSRRAGLR